MAKVKYSSVEDEITFNLIDEKTVARLRREGDIKLPRKGLDVSKDERWNTKQMSSKLLQGILNGDSIPKIAESLMTVVGNNEVSAIRNARTMVTGAENVGRLDSYKELAEKGVVQRKVWIATLDDRTRESHLALDGEEAEIDKAFSNGLMYPGDTDPSVDPSEVWNCRCSMRDHIVGFRRADGSISYIAGEAPAVSETIIAQYKGLDYGEIQNKIIEEAKGPEFYSLIGQYSDGGSYASVWKSYVNGTADPVLIEKLDALLSGLSEIKEQLDVPLPTVVEPEQQEEVQPVEKERIESEALQEVMSEDDYSRFMDLVNDADNGELYRHYADDVEDLTITKTGGSFQPSTQSIEFSYEKDSHEGLSRYSTVAHEYNHFFDSEIGRAEGLHFTEIDLINDRCQIGSGITKPVREWASASDEFLSALRTDMEALRDIGLQECYTEFKASDILRNSSGGVQDALDGFFGTQAKFYGWGHGDRYYNQQYNNLIQSFGHQRDLKDAYNELGFNVTSQAQAKTMFRQYRAASEAWANVGSAVTCGGPELEAMEQYMPNTVEAYKQIVGGLNYE